MTNSTMDITKNKEFHLDSKDPFCRVCGNCDNNKILLAHEMFLGIKEAFEYIFCSKCESLSIKDIPANIENYYKNYYSLNKTKNYSDTGFRNLLKRLLLKSNPLSLQYKLCSSLLQTENDLRLQSFARCNIQKNEAILDVGCGTGNLLDELSFLGYRNLTGIDPFLETDILNDKFNVYKKSIFEIKQKFKLIMFHHSFEHMDNPNEVLSQVYELLDYQGICLIRIPNIDSFSFRKFQGNWFSIHAPFHHFLPSLKGMNLIAENAKLRIQNYVGEQLYYFFLLSVNHSLRITDYEELGIRKYLESNKTIKGNQPLYTQQEVRHWKEKTKKVRGTGFEDWIAYFLIKK